VTARPATGSNSGRRGRRRSAAARTAAGAEGAAPAWSTPAQPPSILPAPARPGPLSLDDIAPPERAVPAFAHASEAEMARILDFYRIRWEYEPHTFPILWNLDGAVVESFSPDFWLPDLELYLEMTTLRQRLVRKKNRKLRRILELYPDIRVKLFYARDFRALMLKFGRLALADALSGTSGQVVPERDRIAAAVLAAPDDIEIGPGLADAASPEPDDAAGELSIGQPGGRA
jgi:hypothetical protein